MQLSSVRSLKEELLSNVEAIAPGLESSMPFAAFTARRDAVTRTLEGIALGIVKVKKGQYRLAVRLQQTGPLASAVAEEIRGKAKGEVDVKFIGSVVKFAGQTSAAFYRQRRRPLRIGSSIGDVPPQGYKSAGTLGCFVVRRTAPYYYGLLSNNHVIAGENANPVGSPIAQPGTLDGGKFPADEIATLGKKIALKRGINYIDAAVADLWDGVEIDPRRIGNLGDLSGKQSVHNLPEQATVYKVGRTTGQTKGRITSFEIDNLHVEYDMGLLQFDNQIEIEGTGNRPFSDSGDSGSLIVDSHLQAIGLLFAGSDKGGSNGKGLTYANPINTVLDAFQVDLEL